MQEQSPRTQPPPQASRLRRVGIQAAVVLGITLLCSVLLPAVPILLGVLLIVITAIHAWFPDLRPYVQPLLRIPVARPSKRHARLLITAGAGVILMLSGAVGATARGHLRTRHEQRARGREAKEELVLDHLERARYALDGGNIVAAELALTEADAIIGVDSDREEEVDLMLARIQRCRDSKAILDILIQLPKDEFDAFVQGSTVPAALEFPERSLTLMAVDLALAKLPEAKKARAGR